LLAGRIPVLPAVIVIIIVVTAVRSRAVRAFRLNQTLQLAAVEEDSSALRASLDRDAIPLDASHLRMVFRTDQVVHHACLS
jgi:hypothetical protein